MLSEKKLEGSGGVEGGGKGGWIEIEDEGRVILLEGMVVEDEEVSGERLEGLSFG